MQRTLIWDVPTCLFHWIVASSFVDAWLTTESYRRLAVHVFLGFLMLGLIAFRVAWAWSVPITPALRRSGTGRARH